MNILPTSTILQQKQFNRRFQFLVWTEQREPHVFNDCSQQPKYVSNTTAEALSVLFPSEFSGLVQQRSLTTLHSSTHFVTFICCHQSQCLNRVNESQGNYPIYFKQYKMSLPSVAERVYLPQTEKIFKLSKRLKYLYIHVTRKHSKKLPINYKVGLRSVTVTYKKWSLHSTKYNLQFNRSCSVSKSFNYELKQSNSATCWKS